jgi:hypothetical protein
MRHFRQALASPHSGLLHRSPIGHGFDSWRLGVDAMKRLFPLVVLAVLLVTGCAARGVRVAELRDQPTKFADKDVRITGVVTSSWGIPLAPFQLYNVDDGSGEITVLSRSGRTPARGTRVEVRGEIRELAVFGGRSVGLHLQEEERKVKS